MRCNRFLVTTGLLFLIISLAGCFESDEESYPPVITELSIISVVINNSTFTLKMDATVEDIDDDVTTVEWQYIDPSLLKRSVGPAKMNRVTRELWTGSDTRAMVSTGGSLINLDDVKVPTSVTIEVRAYDSKGNSTRAQHTVKLNPPPQKSSEPSDVPHGLSDVVVNSRNITITVWDHAQEDGDIIDIALNDKPIKKGLVLANQEQEFSIRLESGRNKITIHAVNEGDIPPNTAAIQISNVVKGKPEQVWQLGLGENASFTLTVQ